VTSHEGQLDQREVKGRRFWYRRGTVDEVVLADAYQLRRFALPKLEADVAPVVVDVGAHIGCFTVLVAAKLPNAMVYALEPAKSNFDLLTRNIAANSLSNVVPLQVALSRGNGVATLHHAAENWGHSLYPDLAGAYWPAENVTVMALDEFMRSNGLSAIDHLKMNIEGAEYDVLLHSSAETLAAVHRMEVEFHPFPTADGSHLASWLSRCGLDVRTSWSVEEVGKGWIHAMRAPRNGPGDDQ
jgi:FkbM family methyltransferase